MSITPSLPDQFRQGSVFTWVKSRWKIMGLPGHFSAKINNLQVTGSFHKLDSWKPDDYEAFVRLPHIWENAEYGAVLRRMKAGLKDEERMVMFYEDLHADQRGTLRQIEEFLGVTPFQYPQPLLNRRFTESAQRPMPDFFPKLFAQDIERITHEVESEGFSIPNDWQSL